MTPKSNRPYCPKCPKNNMNREILITGATGLVGKEVVRQLNKHVLWTPSHAEMDVTKPEAVKQYLDAHPRITDVVHLAAYTNVSKPQNDKEAEKLCFEVNVKGVTNLVEALKGRSIYLAHISTGFVFDGSENNKGPYDEFTVPVDSKLLTKYGRSKLIGETIVRESYPNSSIVRFDNPVTSGEGKDYLRTFLMMANNKTLQSVFENQFITLADLDLVALTVQALIETRRTGNYHISSDVVTPFDIVEFLLQAAEIDYKIERGDIHAYLKSINDPTRYPVNGGLKSDFTRKTLDIPYRTAREITRRLHGSK